MPVCAGTIFSKITWEVRFKSITGLQKSCNILSFPSLSLCADILYYKRKIWGNIKKFHIKASWKSGISLLCLRNLDTLFWCTFQTTHSHDGCLLCVFSEGLQKVENRSILMCKSEQTVCPSKSLWQCIETQINFSVTDNGGLWRCLCL